MKKETSGDHTPLLADSSDPQSTYCATIARHCETIKRSVHVVNLDPAVETCDYPLAADIRDLVSLEDVMEAKGNPPTDKGNRMRLFPFRISFSRAAVADSRAPASALASSLSFSLRRPRAQRGAALLHGVPPRKHGLVRTCGAPLAALRAISCVVPGFCASPRTTLSRVSSSHVLRRLHDVVNDYADDYLIFDCPGQIELYCHLPGTCNLQCMQAPRARATLFERRVRACVHVGPRPRAGVARGRPDDARLPCVSLRALRLPPVCISACLLACVPAPTVMQTIVKQLQLWGYRLCAVYVMDSVLITDPSRFIAGTLMCLSAMVQVRYVPQSDQSDESRGPRACSGGLPASRTPPSVALRAPLHSRVSSASLSLITPASLVLSRHCPTLPCLRALAR